MKRPESKGTPLNKLAQIPETELPVIDRTRLETEFGGDLEILHELRDLFVEHVPPLLVEIRSAFAGADAASVATAAHTLKGAANTYGASRVGEAARIVEMAGRDGRFTGLADDIEILAAELDKVLAALADL